MAETKQIIRIFRLIRALSQHPPLTKTQLAVRLGTTTRTIERDFELLEELGYLVEYNLDYRYFICVEAFPAEKNVQFTLEETQLLQTLLQSERQHPLRDSLVRKLFVHSELRPLSENVMLADQSLKIRLLGQAITERRYVWLRGYYSVHSQNTRDRYVAPTSFSENYESINAYEPESGQEKAFRIDRIFKAELTDQSHQQTPTTRDQDFFGFNDPLPFMVLLRMSDLPYRKLMEEYPATKPFLQRAYPGTNQPYVFRAEVRNVRGIGRFILGFPGEITVEGPALLRDYLNERIKNLRY
ncbi:MAG: WYL domain-containing protein [Microscillaceae bacterium]|nr:WYL domain-containing protein [Microscillaceae bacterium]